VVLQQRINHDALPIGSLRVLNALLQSCLESRLSAFLRLFKSPLQTQVVWHRQKLGTGESKEQSQLACGSIVSSVYRDSQTLSLQESSFAPLARTGDKRCQQNGF